MTDETRAHVAVWLNDFPEVRWDRFTENQEEIVVYGWIDRTDGRSDFLVLQFWNVPEGNPGLTTSSAELSETFALRCFGRDDLEHDPCQRVEAVFGDLVAKKIELPAEVA